jgi:hypothetical protein
MLLVATHLGSIKSQVASALAYVYTVNTLAVSAACKRSFSVLVDIKRMLYSTHHDTAETLTKSHTHIYTYW